mgnify:CR=1 FL=1
MSSKTRKTQCPNNEQLKRHFDINFGHYQVNGENVKKFA